MEENKNEFNASLIIAEHLSKNDFEEFLDDIDFFALALKERFPIRSKDALFKKQSIIKVFTTTELVKHLRYSTL